MVSLSRFKSFSFSSQLNMKPIKLIVLISLCLLFILLSIDFQGYGWVFDLRDSLFQRRLTCQTSKSICHLNQIAGVVLLSSTLF